MKHESGGFVDLRTITNLVFMLVIFMSLATISIMVYICIYMSFIPRFEKELHVELNHNGDAGICFPKGNRTIRFETRDSREDTLQNNQKYDINLVLDTQKSTDNNKIGNFMIYSRIYEDRRTLYETNKSLLLPYFHKQGRLTRLFKSLHMYQSSHQSEIPLFTNIKECDKVWDIELIIMSKSLRIEDTRLKFIARLEGIRYFMYHWRLTTFVLGSFVIFMFVSVSLIILVQLTKTIFTRSGSIQKED